LPWNEFGPMINESNNCTQHDHLKEHMIWESLSWRIKFPAGSHCTATSPDPLYLYAHSDEATTAVQRSSGMHARKDAQYKEILKHMVLKWYDFKTADDLMQRLNNKVNVPPTVHLIESTPERFFRESTAIGEREIGTELIHSHENEQINSQIFFSQDQSPCILRQVVESDLVTENRPSVLQEVNTINPIITTPRFSEEISVIDENSIESSTSIIHFIQSDEFLNTATISTAKTPKTSQDFSIRMFGSRETHIDVTKKLLRALRDKDGWKSIVVLADQEEFYELISKEQVLKVFKTLTMFHHACNLTLTRKMLWLDALKETVEYYQYSGLGVFTLRNKFQDFQKHNYMLPHPNSLKVDSQGKVVRSKEIFFLDIYPDLKLVFQAYARENIRRISVDLMHLYTNDTIIPLLKDEILAGIENNASATSESEDSIDETINKIIQKQHGFRKCIVCRETVSYESG